MRKIIAIFTVLFAGLVLANPVSAANQRFLPNGIDSVSPKKATAQVLDYASLNDEYAQMLARETGAAKFDRKDYRPRGYSKAKKGTRNTSMTSGGKIHISSGAVGTKTLVLVNIKTGKRVEVMVRCANPRVRKGGKCDCKPVRVKKVNRILVNKKFSKRVVHTCPSGQVVRFRVNGRVRGWVRGAVTGRVIGKAKFFLSQQVNLKVKLRISVVCDEMPPPPPVTEELPGPKVYAEGAPAHLYTGGSSVVHFRVTKGAKLDVFGDDQAYVAGFRQVNITWNNQACPIDNDCYAVTVWARDEAGNGYVYAVASLNGKEDMAAFEFPVVKDDF